ncbi:MAG: dipeptide epimerase [Capsulimonadaceae bacterium]
MNPRVDGGIIDGMNIITVRAETWTLPLLAPFTVSQRTATEAGNVVVTVDAVDKKSGARMRGLGACAPVAYVTGESTESATRVIEEAGKLLLDSPPDRLGPLLDRIASPLESAPASRAGLEMAIFDLWARRHRLHLWDYFGGRCTGVQTDITIPITPPDEAGRLAAAAMRKGFRALKIKVGANDADYDRIAAIAAAAPQARLRIDANQAFSPADAAAFARRLAADERPVDLIEQPVAKDDVAGLKYVKENSPFPVYADEAVCTPQSAWRLLREEAVDGINVKIMKSGIRATVEIIGLCRAAGKGVMIGCNLETPLGIAAAVQIAAGTGAVDFVDLDSHYLLAPIPRITGGIACSGPDIRVVSEEGEAGWGVRVANEAAG